MSRVVVTGGNGFVGRFVVCALGEAGHEVVDLRGPDRPDSGASTESAEVHVIDIRDERSLTDVVRGADAIIHLAALLGSPDVELNMAVNARGTENLIAAGRAHSVPRFIFFSSVSAARQGGSAYSRSKQAAEAAVRASDLDWTTLRCEMLLGPGSRGLNKLRRQIEGYPLVVPLPAGGKAVRRPVYAPDVARITVSCLADRRTFHREIDVVGPEAITLRELVGRIGAELGIYKRVLPVPRRLALAVAWTMERCLAHPPFTYDNMYGLTQSTAADDGALRELGFEQASLESAISRSLGVAAASGTGHG